MNALPRPPGAVPPAAISRRGPLAHAPAGGALIAGALLFALLLAMPGMLADPDTLWQSATGAWILAHHAIPHTDPFSYTAFGRPWSPHEWLAETLMSLAGGARGEMALTAAAAGIAFGLLFHHVRRFMAPLPAVMLWLLAVANCTGSLLARPHVLAWPCLELWCAGLVLARARGERPSWWLLPIMAVWVNLHGSFMIGLLLPLPFLVEAAIEAGPAWRRPALQWSLFTAAAWAAALLNPDTAEGVLFPFRLLAMHNLDWIGEWTQADFSAFHPLELTILVLLGAGLLGRLTVPPIRLFMLLGLLHMALQHWRHDQLVGLIGALILAPSIGRLAPAVETVRVRAGLPALAAAIAGLALTVRFLIPLTVEPGAPVFAVLDKIPAATRALPVLNDYGLGAALIAHGEHPFIDSRADMYGDSFLQQFREIAALNEATLARVLDSYHVAWTIFPADSPVLLLLDHRPGWRRLVSRDAAVVHVRDEPR